MDDKEDRKGWCSHCGHLLADPCDFCSEWRKWIDEGKDPAEFPLKDIVQKGLEQLKRLYPEIIIVGELSDMDVSE